MALLRRRSKTLNYDWDTLQTKTERRRKQMKMKRLLLLGALMALVVFMVAIVTYHPVEAAPPPSEKVTMCHDTGADDNDHFIRVSLRACQSHLNHGDDRCVDADTVASKGGCDIDSSCTVNNDQCDPEW